MRRELAPQPPPLIVPAYFHPALRPGDWAAMVANARHLRLVVLNVASGPGQHPDPVYRAAAARVRAAGTEIAGYVDTAYAQRAAADVLADVRRHRTWYGTDAVFYDRVSNGAGAVGHYAELAQAARDLGVRTVAFNHGAEPARGYLPHAELLGAFEGPWASYVDATVAHWAREQWGAWLFHLVHSVPPELTSTAWDLVGARRVGCAYVTEGSGANPWDRFRIGPRHTEGPRAGAAGTPS